MDVKLTTKNSIYHLSIVISAAAMLEFISCNSSKEFEAF